MPYVPIQNFLKVLYEHAPALADWIAKNRFVIHDGLFPVGLKIHSLAPLESLGKPFNYLISELGGRAMLERNFYRTEAATFCLVLPPVGSAEAAIALITCIEQAGDINIFNNPMFQIQVCTPGRLDVKRAGILTLGALLGSDVISRLPPRHVTTTFSRGDYSSRGVRFTIYDGHQGLERRFGWWRRAHNSDVPYRDSRLPYKRKRTDVLTATSKYDIRTINLMATVLVHAHSSHGYWSRIGETFTERMCTIIKRHQLSFDGVPWVCTNEDKGTDAQAERDVDDTTYESAIYELYAYIADEIERISKSGSRNGILFEVHNAITALREDVERETKRLDLKKWRPS